MAHHGKTTNTLAMLMQSIHDRVALLAAKVPNRNSVCTTSIQQGRELPYPRARGCPVARVVQSDFSESCIIRESGSRCTFFFSHNMPTAVGEAMVS